jgi:hypothetical protein
MRPSKQCPPSKQLGSQNIKVEPLVRIRLDLNQKAKKEKSRSGLHDSELAAGESFSECCGGVAANQKNAPVNSPAPANGIGQKGEAAPAQCGLKSFRGRKLTPRQRRR